MAKSIDLSTEQIFHNISNAKGFAIDIGGSLAKVAYSSLVKKRSTTVLEKSMTDDENYCSSKDAIYDVSETDQECLRLHFVKFETKYIESCLDFIQANLIQSGESDKSIKVTGGGAYKYTDLITSKLGVQVDKEDEMECLINGCNFLLKNIPDEAFRYVRNGNPEYRFQGVDCDVFPYLLVNIGSGVSFCKVTGQGEFERIGGTATGGGTFWGLGSLLTNSREFDDLLELAQNGDHRSVDMLVKDIYGGNYPKLGLTGNIIASSFGKAAFGKAARGEGSDENPFKKEDIASSLLLSISNDIGQMAYLHARLNGLKKIYFGGYFIRGHPFTMHTITYSINYWTQRDNVDITPMFLRHEGYLCAIGAFLKGMQIKDKEQYSWGENLAGSSGLQSPIQPNLASADKKDFSILEINRLERPLLPFPLLLDGGSYNPDTVNLHLDEDARQYWLNCFANGAGKTSNFATKSQVTEVDADKRAKQFLEKYLCRLDSLRQNPCAYGTLTVRTLLDTSTHFLEECRFTDIFSQQKQQENKQALRELATRLEYLDSLDTTSRHYQLALGILAGNVFDWGAKEVTDILEVKEFGLQEAQDKLQKRPWLFDDYDAWLTRLTTKEPYKCAVIFCDNSGYDIILGILPFARQLLSMGTNVIICANSSPSLNDVVYTELLLIVKKASEICPVIGQAYEEGRFMLMESGQASPCLDLRLIDEELVNVINEQSADLVVIEGMGRAVHTNMFAAFSCDVLKTAVIKNKWLANHFGGEMFSVMFKYERARCVRSADSPSKSMISSRE